MFLSEILSHYLPPGKKSLVEPFSEHLPPLPCLWEIPLEVLKEMPSSECQKQVFKCSHKLNV